MRWSRHAGHGLTAVAPDDRFGSSAASGADEIRSARYRAPRARPPTARARLSTGGLSAQLEAYRPGEGRSRAGGTGTRSGTTVATGASNADPAAAPSSPAKTESWNLTGVLPSLAWLLRLTPLSPDIPWTVPAQGTPAPCWPNAPRIASSQLASLRYICARAEDRRIAVPFRRDNVLQGGLMPRQPFAFSRSPLLGDRAEKVYEWFLRALAADGDIAECGVFAGATSYEFTRYLETMKIPKRVHLFDTFNGLPDIITDQERGTTEGGPLPGKFSCKLSAVSARMESLSQYKLHPGLFSETLPLFDQPLCFIHADADLYESTLEVIGLADRCLTKEGVVVFDDYDSPYYSGVRLAIEGALDPRRYTIIPSRETTQCYAIKSSGA